MTLSRRMLVLTLALAATLTQTSSPALAQSASPTACQAAGVTPTPENLGHIESAVLCLVNRERTRRGLKRLLANPRLKRAAAAHSKDMVRRSFFAHNSPSGSTPAQRIRGAGYLRGARGYTVGENIAWGTGQYATPQETVASWMDSPGHRANILHRSFKEIGIGVALGAPGEGADGATYTTNFGARL
jgi:uncharacterized protein YkwD